MKAPTAPHYVLTGGPCAGKTTTIFELEKRGFTVAPEPARLYIDKRLASGESIDAIKGDPNFCPQVVTQALEIYQSIPREEICFFDRSVPDSLAYYRAFNIKVDATLLGALEGLFFAKVFLLDLVDFENDEARDETPEEAARIHGLIADAYRELGYTTIEVPVMPVERRADFILANLE